MCAMQALTQGNQKGVTCRYRLQSEVVLLNHVDGDQAEQLAAELPGLVTVHGSEASRKAVVADARHHEKLLEKVRTDLQNVTLSARGLQLSPLIASVGALVQMMTKLEASCSSFWS